MKKILALAAVAALTAGVSAYAANPFSDVTADDWAYQAVSDLSAQGVVEGYPDGTFKGEKNMTRYELAQIVARLMAKEDQLNAEQQATIDKLAGEYADELANLGVRVSDLEKKVGNISWAGDARMRFQQKSIVKNSHKTADWNGRIRLNVKGQVNENTYVKGRFVNNMKFKDEDTSNTYMDQIYVHHQFGDNLGVELGRLYLGMGSNDEFYGDSFDGAKAIYSDGAFGAEVGYGRLQAAQRDGYKDLVVSGKENTFFAKAGFNEANYGLTANYLKTSTAEGDAYITKDGKVGDIAIWGVDANVKLGDAVKVYGSYFQETKQAGDPTYWYAGVQYGQANRNKPGSFNVAAQYNDIEHGSVLGPTGTWATNAYSVAAYKGDDVTFWSLLSDVTLQKNVTLHAEYSFDINGDKYDYKDAYSFSLNYKF